MPFVPSSFCIANNEYSWMRRLTEEPVNKPSEGFTSWPSDRCAPTDDIWANVEADRNVDTGNKSRASHLHGWTQCPNAEKAEVKSDKWFIYGWN